jgi:hypothetical protein
MGTGVQLLVNVGQCQTLSKALSCNDLGVLLCLVWRWDAPGNLMASLRTTNLPPLRIGDNFWTGDIALDLVVGTAGLKISFRAKAYFRPSEKEQPLELEIAAALEPVGFEISGSMKGLWRNPFGLCEDLVLGPDLIIALQLSYASAAPTRFSFVGGVKVGRAGGRLDLQVSANPKGESKTCQ